MTVKQKQKQRRRSWRRRRRRGGGGSLRVPFACHERREELRKYYNEGKVERDVSVLSEAVRGHFATLFLGVETGGEMVPKGVLQRSAQGARRGLSICNLHMILLKR
jgi:hypothetical protein